MTTTAITPQTTPPALWSALYDLRNAVLAARQDGDHAGAITVDAMRAVAIVVAARLAVARWAANRPALEAAIRRGELLRRRRAAQQAPATALDRVAAGNAALAALALDREAEARRAFRAEIEGAATRDAVALALDELAAGKAGKAAERFAKAATYVRAGARWAELAGGALTVSRGASDHEIEAGRPCSCKAGQNGLACWATAVAEGIALARRQALADLEGAERRAA